MSSELLVQDVLDAGDVVMLTTTVDHATAPGLESRPLTCLEVGGEKVSFLVPADAAWVADLVTAAPAQRQATVTRDHDGRYVALSGTAKVVDDPRRVRALWTDAADAYFGGPDDPRVRLLDVDLQAGEWWEAPTSTVGSLLSLAGTVLFRRPPGDAHGDVV